jgi:putative transposase
MAVAQELARDIPVRVACDSLGVAPSTFYRMQQPALPKAECVPRPKPPNALSEQEKSEIRMVLNSPEYADLSVPQAYTKLLDTGRYLASIRTMYRVLDEQGEVCERRNQRVHPKRSAPVLCVRAPNELWSWDITRLPGWTKGVLLYLYVVLDVFSRFVVGWLIAERQATDLAITLISESLNRHGLIGHLTGQDGACPLALLTLLNDNGGPMTAKPFSVFLEDMHVRHVLTRPHTPNDNAFSEAQFKTMKYRPDFPDALGGILDARGWGETFFDWYNHYHYHSGIGMLTPATVFYGRVEQIQAVRQRALALAFSTRPERFHYRVPILNGPPQEVWINRPINHPGLIQPSGLLKL